MTTSIETTTPATIVATETGSESTAEIDNGVVERRHDLDALRAIAMLLGIVLHAALSFTSLPWTVKDAQQSAWYDILFAAIHGFRMPLFFLISGFFTAMLWRKRGLGGLIKQRMKRILLPLVLGCLTIVPAMWAVSMFTSAAPEDSEAIHIFDAAAKGDTAAVKAAIELEAIAIDALHPASGASLLTVATFCGQTETVDMLLQSGADPNQKNGDSGTPLHVAVFMGRVAAATSLMQAGADPDAVDGNGNTPQDNLKVDFGTTNFIAQLYGQSLTQDELEVNRAEIAKLFGADEGDVAQAVSSPPGLGALYGLLFQFPAFMHLWFLAFLCWLVVAFIGYAFLAQTMKIERLPKWLFCSSVSLLWLIPLTMVPQYFMMPEVFGPDVSVGLLPIPNILGYYAIFFFFGAIYWDLGDIEGVLGRRWYIALPVALLIVFPVGLELVSGTLGIWSQDDEATNPWVGNLLQATYTWLMIFGCVGLFRALLSTESKVMRYISDSSYWLYLVHLPLVILAQWVVKDLPLPGWIKFVGIVVVLSAFLLVTYEYLVRYTFIGSVLNGPKKCAESTSRPVAK